MVVRYNFSFLHSCRHRMSSLTKKPTRWPYLGLLGWTIFSTVVFILDLFLPWVFKSRVHLSTKPWVHCPFKSIAGRSTPPSGTDSFRVRVVVCQLSLQNKKTSNENNSSQFSDSKKNQLHPPHPESSSPRSLQCWGFNSSPKAKILHRMAWQKNTKKKNRSSCLIDTSMPQSTRRNLGSLFAEKKVPGRSARKVFGSRVRLFWCVGFFF